MTQQKGKIEKLSKDDYLDWLHDNQHVWDVDRDLQDKKYIEYKLNQLIEAFNNFEKGGKG